jgi:hypothetical protein
VKTKPIDKTKVDFKTKIFMDFFEKNLGVTFVDVTPKKKRLVK